MKVQPIPLSSVPSTDFSRPVKRGALAVFRLMRSAAAKASSVPGLVAQASRDVREAWEESSRPNV